MTKTLKPTKGIKFLMDRDLYESLKEEVLGYDNEEDQITALVETFNDYDWGWELGGSYSALKRLAIPAIKYMKKDQEKVAS